jgi:hypothetical protein
MNGGVISGNTSHLDGGGAYMLDITFTMKGGEISGNIASNNGGGVDCGSGTFIMKGGVISGNTARFIGGGICLNTAISFVKTGGTVYGYDSAAQNASLNNKVVNSSGDIQNGKGHAIYLIRDFYRKENTVGPDAKLYYKFPIYDNISVYDNISGWD